MCSITAAILLVSSLLPIRATADPVSSAVCRTECIQQFLGTEPKDDKECAIDPDCFLCWEHCGLLSRNNRSKDTLCQDDYCSTGCEVACGWFRSKRQLPKDRLVFPGQPALNGELLEWGPVPGAGLYSVSLVFLNRTVADFAQTVSCKLKIPKTELLKVARIVVIAVNKAGALGLTNFNLSRRIVKKNASITASKLKEILDMNDNSGFAPTILNPSLWLTQGNTMNIDGTIGRTNISWEFVRGGEEKTGARDFLVKWWTPDLNMEGRIVVNGPTSIELTYLSKYFSFVKVKVIGQDVESQILILKKENEELSSEAETIPRYWILFLCINIFLIAFLIIVKILWNCKINSSKFIEKPPICYDVYT